MAGIFTAHDPSQSINQTIMPAVGEVFQQDEESPQFIAWLIDIHSENKAVVGREVQGVIYLDVM